MDDPALPAPVTPPRGGFNDFHPPPPAAVRDLDHYIARILGGQNRAGAAWRICTLMQPRSVHELIGRVAPVPPVQSDVAMALTDAYADWVDAGKPATPR